jgi:hypothetical protein
MTSIVCTVEGIQCWFKTGSTEHISYVVPVDNQLFCLRHDVTSTGILEGSDKEILADKMFNGGK